MQVVVDSLLTTYHRAGKGKTIVILHGWGDNSQGWTSFAHTLAHTYDVIRIDLPGFGATETPRAAWGLDDYAQFVAAFVAKLELEPYAYVGHSNGGAIAIRGIATRTLHCQKLVLLASAGIRGEYKGRNRALRLATKTGKALTLPLPHSFKNKLRSAVYKNIGSDMLVAENLQSTFKNIVQDDVRHDAAAISLPVLLVYGDQDEQTPLRHANILQQHLPDSRLEVITGADHFAHLTHESAVLQLVEKFLS